MKQKTAMHRFSTLVFGGVCLTAGLVVVQAFGAPDKAAAAPADGKSIKGTCTWGNTKSAWSAKLTPKGDGTYDAVYDSTWGGKPLKYVGTIKTDLKTTISGTGKASEGKGNGNFEFSGKFGDDGIAQCSYKEIGGRRSGSMTAELPK